METQQISRFVFVERCPGLVCFERHHRFKDGRESLEDDSRSGRPSSIEEVEHRETDVRCWSHWSLSDGRDDLLEKRI